MSSYFVVLQDEIDEIDSYVALKTLTKAASKLKEIAEDIGVSPLSGFVFGDERDREDYEDIAENEGWDYSPGGGKGDEWFDADEGLDTVRALLGYIESDPESLKRPKAATEELKALEAVLEAARDAGTKFRFEFDE
jgi:hypothetical protein